MENVARKIMETLNEIECKNEDEGITCSFKKPELPQTSITKNKSTLLHKYLQQNITKTLANKILPRSNDAHEVKLDPSSSEGSGDELKKKINCDLLCSYKEPSWSGYPCKPYSLQELKSGIIERTIEIDRKFIVFGRLESCDVTMAHPTISRHHAVLQYRAIEEDNSDLGFYIYDLGSTHGTFLNKYRLKPKHYLRVKVGHVIKFGCSTRLFILQGPSEDEEEESELSMTELKEQRKTELEERERKEEEEKRSIELEKERRQKAFEERGVDWGMGEDADEETDLSENPFAATTNEELYIDDPKKILRHWFEREGEELSYQVEQAEKGSFCCKIILPIDNGSGKDVVVDVMGKSKKEATFQCALEACRQIDRQGFLRQSHHESRKRQTKNWEENDFYDSDEDNFLDRTGQIEQKREKRMRKMGKIQETVETYDSLMDKHRQLLLEIEKFEKTYRNLKTLASNKSLNSNNDNDDDALDAFMKNLKQKCPSKLDLKKCQQELLILKKEEERLRKLINIAKPASLPELKMFEVKTEEMKVKKFDNSQNQIVLTEENHSIKNITKIDSGSTIVIENRVVGPQVQKNEEFQTNDDKKRKRSHTKTKKKIQKNPEVITSIEDDYNNCIWTPPEGQTGDGRTSLNDKFGY